MRPVTLVSLALLAGFLPNAAQATTFDVTRLDDPASRPCTPGDCSLRGALDRANAAPDRDLITLPAGTIRLTLPEASLGGDSNADGDLGVAPGTTLEIAGAGMGATSIDAGGAFRVLRAVNATVAIRDLTIAGGRATGPASLGGGLAYLADVPAARSLLVSRVRFSGNQTTPDPAGNDAGGGAYIEVAVGSVDLDEVRADGNSASIGGGVYIDGPPATVALTRSLIDANRAAFGAVALGGGGIVENTTITGNTLTEEGAVQTQGPTDLVYATVVENAAPAGAIAGVVAQGPAATIALLGSVLHNQSGDDCGAVAGGTIGSAGHNRVRGQCLVAPTVALPTDGVLPPRFSDVARPLADNGGATPTHAPVGILATAGVAGQGECPETDQRGVPRVGTGSACTPGAYINAPVDVVSAVTGPASVGRGERFGVRITATNQSAVVPARVGLLVSFINQAPEPPPIPGVACARTMPLGSQGTLLCTFDRAVPPGSSASFDLPLVAPGSNPPLVFSIVVNVGLDPTARQTGFRNPAHLSITVRPPPPSITAIRVGISQSGISRAAFCTAGLFSGAPGTTVAVEWLQDGVSLGPPSAEPAGRSLAISAAMVGRRLGCRLIASSSEGTTTAVSTDILVTPRCVIDTPRPRRRVVDRRAGLAVSITSTCVGRVTLALVRPSGAGAGQFVAPLRSGKTVVRIPRSTWTRLGAGTYRLRVSQSEVASPAARIALPRPKRS